jgi:DNA ligase (NAD+)
MLEKQWPRVAKHYKNIDAIATASLMDLVLVDEIGEICSKCCDLFFENQKNRLIIDRLKNYGVQLNKC